MTREIKAIETREINKPVEIYICNGENYAKIHSEKKLKTLKLIKLK